jgi:hypothetical protein
MKNGKETEGKSQLNTQTSHKSIPKNQNPQSF